MLIEKEKLIIYGLGSPCAFQTVMLKNYQCYRRQVWGLKRIKLSIEADEMAVSYAEAVAHSFM